MISEIVGMDGIVVLVIAVVVFIGSNQLPKLEENVAAASREFRKIQRVAKRKVAPHDNAHAMPVSQFAENFSRTNIV